ncbi:MAG: hypothetical protein ABI330_17875 [Caldimonas sp.]
MPSSMSASFSSSWPTRRRLFEIASPPISNLSKRAVQTFLLPRPAPYIVPAGVMLASATSARLAARVDTIVPAPGSLPPTMNSTLGMSPLRSRSLSTVVVCTSTLPAMPSTRNLGLGVKGRLSCVAAASVSILK